MKKIIFVLFLISSLFVFYACQDRKDPIPSSTEDPITTEPIPTVPIVLSSPQNVVLDGLVLSWDPVASADGYLLSIDERLFELSDVNSFNLGDITLLASEHELKVQAIRGLEVSEPSESISYTSTLVSDESLIRELVSSVFHPGLEADLTLEDFRILPEYPPDYLGYALYKKTVSRADVYASSAALLNLDEQKAVDFINDMMTFEEDIMYSENFTALLQEMDIFETEDISPYAAAYLLYQMMLAEYDAWIAYEDAHIEYFELLVDLMNTHISNIFSSAYNQEVYDYLISIADPSMIDAIDNMLLETDQQAIDLYQAFNTMAYERYGFFQIYFNPTYHMSDPETIEYAYILKDLVNLAYLDSPQFLFDFYTNQSMSQLDDVIDQKEYYLSWIEDKNAEKLRHFEQKEKYSGYETIYVASLEQVIGFILDLKNVFPENALALIDRSISGDALSTQEVLTIKNEITFMLLEEMPSSYDFSLFFESLMFLSVDMRPIDQELTIDASNLGLITYQQIGSMLSFVHDMDEEMVEHIKQNIIDFKNYNLFTPTQSSIAINQMLFSILVDYFIYVDENPLDDFVSLSKDQMESMYITFLNFLIYVTPDGFIEPIHYIALQNEFDTFYQAFEVMTSLGDDFMTYLLDSEGILFDQLFSLMLLDASPEDFDIVVDDIESLIASIFDLNSALLVDITKDEIGSILDALSISYIAEFDYRYADVDHQALYLELRPDMIDIVYNANQLKNDFIENFSLLATSTIQESLHEQYQNPEQTLLFTMIEAIDLTFDQTNEDLLIETIQLIFDHVVSQSFFMRKFTLPISEVETLRESWVSYAEQLIVDVRLVSDMDHSNLSENDETLISILEFKINRLLDQFQPVNQNDFLTIVPGIELSVHTLTNHETFIKFIPSTSGTYTLTQYDSIYLHCSLFDEHFNELKYDWSNRFKPLELTYTYEAGQTYYFMIYVASDLRNLPYDVDLTFVDLILP